MALDSRPLLVSIDLPFGGTNLEENLMSHTGLAASELSHMSHIVTHVTHYHTLSHIITGLAASEDRQRNG